MRPLALGCMYDAAADDDDGVSGGGGWSARAMNNNRSMVNRLIGHDRQVPTRVIDCWTASMHSMSVIQWPDRCLDVLWWNEKVKMRLVSLVPPPLQLCRRHAVFGLYLHSVLRWNWFSFSDSWGYRWLPWRWVEQSACTLCIPATVLWRYNQNGGGVGSTQTGLITNSFIPDKRLFCWGRGL